MINLIFELVWNHVVLRMYKEEVYALFFLIAVIRSVIIVVFWFLTFWAFFFEKI